VVSVPFALIIYVGLISEQPHQPSVALTDVNTANEVAKAIIANGLRRFD